MTNVVVRIMLKHAVVYCYQDIKTCKTLEHVKDECTDVKWYDVFENPPINKNRWTSYVLVALYETCG